MPGYPTHPPLEGLSATKREALWEFIRECQQGAVYLVEIDPGPRVQDAAVEVVLSAQARSGEILTLAYPLGTGGEEERLYQMSLMVAELVWGGLSFSQRVVGADQSTI